MPATNTHVFKHAIFTHKGVDYDVAAYQKPNDAHLYVVAEVSGEPVVFTYKDGYQASVVYSVEPLTAFGFKQATGNSAIDELMLTAEADVRRMV